VQNSRFVTLRGLTITGAGGQAIRVMEGEKHNQAIHLERNRIFGNGVVQAVERLARSVSP
jgi:hypothetical protein